MHALPSALQSASSWSRSYTRAMVLIVLQKCKWFALCSDLVEAELGFA